jgi:hypothetical protein
MDHRPKDSFSMSYASRTVIFPGVVDHNAVDVVVGEDKGFQADVPTFQLILTYSLQVRSRVHIDSAVGVAEGVFQFLFQLHPILPQISVDHLIASWIVSEQ